MGVRSLHHVGIVVDDLDAAIAFFVDLGLERTGAASVEGEWVDRVVGLEGVRSDLAFVQTPDGGSRLELVRFESPPAVGEAGPPPSNRLGIRHLAFEVDDLDAAIDAVRANGHDLVGEVQQYEDVYRVCYVRGPEGIIVELAERV